MDINKTLEQFILFDKTDLLNEINKIKENLKINKEFKVPIVEMSSIYFKNLSFDTSIKETKEQIELNKEKDLELYCTYQGKMLYLKGFGKIKNIDKIKMENIFKLLMLMRVVKKLDEMSYLSSQYYRSDKQFDELFSN